MHRIHVIKVPTTNNELFPYSHYNDYNHDPYLNAYKKDGELVIECEDLFKLKPNVQSKKRNRIDIYIPSKSALDLGVEIVSFSGQVILPY